MTNTRFLPTLCLAAAAWLSGWSGPAVAETREELTLKRASVVLDEMQGMPDLRVPQWLLARAEGLVILPEVVKFGGRGFNDWIVHFSACGTIGVEQQRLAKFIAATNVAMLVGYKRDVDWMEGAALDLLLFSWLQSYKNLRTFWGGFKKQYAGLIAATGLQVYHG